MLQAGETMGFSVMDDEKLAERRRARNAARIRRWRRKKKIEKRYIERYREASALVSDYPGLIRAIVRRRQALGLRQLAMDERTGLPDGYQGKLECGMKHLGPMSLPLVLGALGLRLLVVPEDGRPMVVPKVRRAAVRRKR